MQLKTSQGRINRHFLGDWQGALVCDDYVAYKQLFTQGIEEAGCMAHARRYFFELHANHQSQIAAQALHYIAQLYEIEREVKTLRAAERQRIHILDGSATAKAFDYSLRRWGALMRFLDDGQLPIDNNWVENQIRPVAVGRSNWLFAGSLRAGQRAAAIMSLIQSARLNGHDPYAYLKEVLTRLPTQKNSQIADMLPHRWQPAQS